MESAELPECRPVFAMRELPTLLPNWYCLPITETYCPLCGHVG
ncbi:hypothetical protein [Streptomyces geranii]|nr:hypothetical protein [Streptomyces geranii]